MDSKPYEESYYGTCPEHNEKAEIKVFRVARRQTPTDLQLIAPYSGARCQLDLKCPRCGLDGCGILPPDIREPIIL